MIIDYAGFTRASNLVHLLQGSALLLLGSAEAYSLKNNGKKYMLAVSLLVAVLGAAMFVAVDETAIIAGSVLIVYVIHDVFDQP